MSLVGTGLPLGLILGIGLVLCASPRLWPRANGPAVRVSRLGEAYRSRTVLAGLPEMPLLTFVALSAVFGLLATGIAHATLGIIAVTLVSGAAGTGLPWFIVLRRSAARRRRNRSIWPDVVDHLVASIRSGQSLPDAIVSLESAGPPVTREAFGEFGREYSATGSFDHAVGKLKGRLSDPTADRIFETVRMARDVGGTELTAVLVGLGRYLRSESAVRHELEARQGWVMNAARLGAVAPWIVLLLLATRPEAVDAYNTPAGIAVLGIGALVTAVAYRAMRAIGRLPEEKRWFV